MMDEPLVSIIVPVYKVEPYLRRCLDSIVNQTYSNLEIILIDDGSPDNCPKICDEYSIKDNRVVVIHKGNGGLSDARNVGLDICKGDYILFVDSDDWIANTCVEIMLDTAINNDVDIVISNFIKTQDLFDIDLSNCTITSTKLLNPIDAVKGLWSEHSTAFTTVWGVLYAKKILENQRFPKGLIHEDLFTSYKFLYQSPKTAFIDLPLYCYFQRSDSITKEYTHPFNKKILPRYERYVYFKNNCESDIVALCLTTLCWEFIAAFVDANLNDNFPLGFENKNKLLCTLRVIVKDSLKFCSLSLIKKFFLFSVYYLPSIYLLYKKTLRFFNLTKSNEIV